MGPLRQARSTEGARWLAGVEGATITVVGVTAWDVANLLGLPVETVVEVFGMTGLDGVADDLEVEVSLPPKKEKDELRQRPAAPWRNRLARTIAPNVWNQLKRE